MARHALLIGVSEFADERLARLNAPTNDVTALQGILRDTSRGNFDSVELSLNEDFLAVRDRVSSFFHDRPPDDVLLLYYSGHGILGRGNRLFLATSGSNLDTPRTCSIASQEIRDFIEESRAQRQIVVLDCCHSGAFAEHAKASAPPPAVTSNTFSSGDAGLFVLTAADTLQFAWDGADLQTGNEAAAGFSQFTSWLVEGLEKGEAAPDDEQITMDALYRYLSRRARAEGSAATPQRFVQGGVGDLVISANPLTGVSQIDPGIMAALAAEEFRARLGAVAELTLQMEEIHTVAARAARRLLQRHLDRERDYQVRRAITRALDEGSNRPPEAARQAEEEKQRAETARRAEEEQRRAAAARQAEEEALRAETARRATWEKEPAEVARRAERERNAEAAGLAGDDKRGPDDGHTQTPVPKVAVGLASVIGNCSQILARGVLAKRRWVLSVGAAATLVVLASGFLLFSLSVTEVAAPPRAVAPPNVANLGGTIAIENGDVAATQARARALCISLYNQRLRKVEISPGGTTMGFTCE